MGPLDSVYFGLVAVWRSEKPAAKGLVSCPTDFRGCRRRVTSGCRNDEAVIERGGEVEAVDDVLEFAAAAGFAARGGGEFMAAAHFGAVAAGFVRGRLER